MEAAKKPRPRASKMRSSIGCLLADVRHRPRALLAPIEAVQIPTELRKSRAPQGAPAPADGVPLRSRASLDRVCFRDGGREPTYRNLISVPRRPLWDNLRHECVANACLLLGVIQTFLGRARPLLVTLPYPGGRCTISRFAHPSVTESRSLLKPWLWAAKS